MGGLDKSTFDRETSHCEFYVYDIVIKNFII